MGEGRDCYIVDLRREWVRRPYITFWRPDNAGYAYPLSWAGKYAPERVRERAAYYITRRGRWLIRFAAPCSAVDAMAEAPRSGVIDGDAGPVVPNTAENRAALRRLAFTPTPAEGGA
jgi:hypothetical protein